MHSILGRRLQLVKCQFDHGSYDIVPPHHDG
jgi:hypothetical protein